MLLRVSPVAGAAAPAPAAGWPGPLLRAAAPPRHSACVHYLGVPRLPLLLCLLSQRPQPCAALSSLLLELRLAPLVQRPAQREWRLDVWHDLAEVS